MANAPGERGTVARTGRRVAITVAGTVVTAVGGVMLFLPPLPGIAVTLAGLALLATEHDWAQRWLARARERFSRPDGPEGAGDDPPSPPARDHPGPRAPQ